MRRRIGRFFFLAAVTVSLLSAVLFAVANRENVTVSLFPLPFEMEMPLFLLTLLSMIAGVLLASVAIVFERLRQRRHIKRQRARIEALENELKAYRQPATAALPVAV